MDPIVRARLERLEALIDAAPSPYAWVQLCAALSEWPDHDELELGIEFVRARMHAWPRALRTAPEWWRMAWERCIPEPRLVLAGTLEPPLLPAKGGGSCPVQYDLFHRDRVYYVRFRHDELSVDLVRIGERMIDFRPLFDAGLECIETQSIGIGGSWSDEETNVMLSLISAAIRRNDFSTLLVPESKAALRASEHYQLGPYPLYVTRWSESAWSDPYQACNSRWMEIVRLGEPVSAAVVHHLSSTRPAMLGSMPRPTHRVWFPWSPWSDPPPEPAIIKRRCELRLLRRVTVGLFDEGISIDACAFVDDDHVAFETDDQSLYVLDLRSYSWAPPDSCEEAAAALARAPAPDYDQLPDCVALDDHNNHDEFVFLDDGRVAAIDGQSLRIWDAQTGVCQAELVEGLDGIALATRGRFVVFGDFEGELWIFEVGPAEVVSGEDS